MDLEAAKEDAESLMQIQIKNKRNNRIIDQLDAKTASLLRNDFAAGNTERIENEKSGKKVVQNKGKSAKDDGASDKNL